MSQKWQRGPCFFISLGGACSAVTEPCELGVQDEKGALADAVKGALAAARTAAQQGNGGEAAQNGHATDDAALDAALARHLERRQAEVAPTCVLGDMAGPPCC